MIIRRATHKDSSFLVEMFRTEIVDDPQMALQFAEDTLSTGITLMAIEDKRLCGTLSWTRRWGFEDGVVELTGLGVNETYRQQGIASALMDQLILDARKLFEDEGEHLRVIMIFMERKNEIARKFYGKHGFSEVGIIPALYPHDDGVLWSRHFGK